MNRRTRKLVCLHEAGHAVVAAVLGVPVRWLGFAGGARGTPGSLACAELTSTDSPHHIEAAIDLAGPEAVEMAQPGGTLWLQNSLERARSVQSGRVEFEAMVQTSSRLISKETRQSLEAEAAELRRGLCAALDDHQRALFHLEQAGIIQPGAELTTADARRIAAFRLTVRELLRRHWRAVELVAAAMDADGEVSGEYVSRVVQETRGAAIFGEPLAVASE